MLIAFQRDLAFERARASGHCSGDLDYVCKCFAADNMDTGQCACTSITKMFRCMELIETMIPQLLDVVHADQKLYLVFEFLDKVQ